MQEHEYTGKAMGTDYAISIVCDSKDLAESISNTIIHTIEQYEKQFSRFLPESELSRLNLHKDMVVSEEFMMVTKKAFELFTATKGIFNPLVQIGRIGYDNDFSKIDTSVSLEKDDAYNIDFETVQLHNEGNRIILRDGQKLDFGGFLKGYLAEILCKKIMKESPLITGAIVNIGGDIHTQGVDAAGELFVFDIYNPVTETDIPITLHNQSLATSGTYKRAWVHSNMPVHHILDSSGMRNPDSDIVSSSIIGTDGGTTEAYAKVFLSLGEKALHVLQEKNIVFALIKKDGSVIKNFA
jgi:thiamine biosynthesis lipoprotein